MHSGRSNSPHEVTVVIVTEKDSSACPIDELVGPLECSVTMLLMWTTVQLHLVCICLATAWYFSLAINVPFVPLIPIFEFDLLERYQLLKLGYEVKLIRTIIWIESQFPLEHFDAVHTRKKRIVATQLGNPFQKPVVTILHEYTVTPVHLQHAC